MKRAADSVKTQRLISDDIRHAVIYLFLAGFMPRHICITQRVLIQLYDDNRCCFFLRINLIKLAFGGRNGISVLAQRRRMQKHTHTGDRQTDGRTDGHRGSGVPFASRLHRPLTNERLMLWLWN